MALCQVVNMENINWYADGLEWQVLPGITGAFPVSVGNFHYYTNRIGAFHGSINHAETGEILTVILKFEDGAVVAFNPWQVKKLENV